MPGFFCKPVFFSFHLSLSLIPSLFHVFRSALYFFVLFLRFLFRSFSRPLFLSFFLYSFTSSFFHSVILSTFLLFLIFLLFLLFFLSSLFVSLFFLLFLCFIFHPFSLCFFLLSLLSCFFLSIFLFIFYSFLSFTFLLGDKWTRVFKGKVRKKCVAQNEKCHDACEWWVGKDLLGNILGLSMLVLARRDKVKQRKAAVFFLD